MMSMFISNQDCHFKMCAKTLMSNRIVVLILTKYNLTELQFIKLYTITIFSIYIYTVYVHTVYKQGL